MAAWGEPGVFAQWPCALAKEGSLSAQASFLLAQTSRLNAGPSHWRQLWPARALDEVEHVDTCGKVCRSAQSCLAHVARRGGVRCGGRALRGGGRVLAAVVVVVLLWREMADDVRQRLRLLTDARV